MTFFFIDYEIENLKILQENIWKNSLEVDWRKNIEFLNSELENTKH